MVSRGGEGEGVGVCWAAGSEGAELVGGRRDDGSAGMKVWRPLPGLQRTVISAAVCQQAMSARARQILREQAREAAVAQ